MALTKEERLTLLRIARKAVKEAVSGQEILQKSVDLPGLQKHQGAFVTLKNGEILRGCIGRFIANEPLWQIVQEMAAAAATEDPRFIGNPITLEEVKALNIEISVLSALEKIENPLNLELGKHGIYIKKGFRSGCFLPQVATETGWSKEEFLSRCASMKAGLEPFAWKDPDTEVYVFTAEKIDEKEEAKGP